MREFDERPKHFSFGDLFFIPITFLFEDVLMLLGENWCWSLLGLNGLLNPSTIKNNGHQNIFPKNSFFPQNPHISIYTKGYDSSKCAHHSSCNNGKKIWIFKEAFNVMISFFVVRYRIYWKLLAAHVALYTDSGHFVMPPLVSLQKDVWEMDAEIPHWWHVTTQIWVVLLIGWKFASTNQSEALLRSGQYQISAIIPQASFWGTRGDMAKWWLFCQATESSKNILKNSKFAFLASQPLKHKWCLSSEVISPSDQVLVMDYMESILFYCSLFIMQILLSLLRLMVQYTRYYQMKCRTVVSYHYYYYYYYCYF